MWQFYEPLSLVMMIGIFYLLPFLIGVILPAWLIPTIVAKIFNRKKEKLPSISPFVFSMIALAIAANLFWEFGLYNKVYYEWDRIFLPYTFFMHESVSVGEGSNWIAPGWETSHLSAIWFALSVSIYVISAVFAGIKVNKERNKTYKKILIVSVLSLIITTLVAPALVAIGVGFLFSAPMNLNYKEVNVPCVVPSSAEPKILYTGDQSEWISDLSGTNIRKAFAKNLQLKGSTGSISPDGSMAAIFWGNDLWIHCVHSEGAFKITLPSLGKDTGTYSTRSFPSWSPDSKQMVMNNNGDLALINLETKQYSVLKSEVAFRDNKIDLRSKDRNKNINPFEYGDAYWNADGIVYYTAFSGETVLLKKFDPKTATDKVVLQREKQLNIRTADRSGEWLYINEWEWSFKRSESSQDKSFLLNTKNGEITTEPFERVKFSSILLSPSGRYFAMSTSSWQSSPELKAIPATVDSIKGSEHIDVSQMVETALNKKGVQLNDRIVVVDIKDFIEDKKVVVVVYLRKGKEQLPQQFNGIIDLNTQELTVLQEYPETSFDNNSTERLEPYQVVK